MEYYKKNKYIQINLSIKDREHLLKIENHIGKITKYEDINKVYIRIFDKPTVISISNAFKWRSNKTKYPHKYHIFKMKISYLVW